MPQNGGTCRTGPPTALPVSPRGCFMQKGPSKIRAQGSLTSRGCSRNTFPGCRGPATGRRDPLLLRHVPRIRGIPHRQLLHLWKGYVPRTQGIPCSTSSSPKSRRVCSPDNDARRVSATGIFPGYGGFPDQLGDLSDGISYLPRIYPAVSVLCRGRLRTFPNPGPVLCGAFGVQILAMGAILQTATGISLIPAALIASIVTLAYTWSGGILAVTLTDAVQYVIIVIGVTLCGYLAIDHLGGFDAMMSILYSNPRFESNMKPMANWSLVQFLGLFFSFLRAVLHPALRLHQIRQGQQERAAHFRCALDFLHGHHRRHRPGVHGDPARREARPRLHQPYPRHPCPPASPGSCSGRCSPPSCPPARP